MLHLRGVDINRVASFHIVYKKYNDVSYKLDIPPSPSSTKASLCRLECSTYWIHKTLDRRTCAFCVFILKLAAMRNSG